MKHTIQALVENKFGVLARIASLFSARGYNINSLSVGETEDATISCMTIVVNAEDERILEQIKKQLNKLIDVITVVDFTRRDYVDRELILVKMRKKEKTDKDLKQLIKEFGLKVADEKENQLILEICDDHHKVNEILKNLRKLGIKELARTGKAAILK